MVGDMEFFPLGLYSQHGGKIKISQEYNMHSHDNMVCIFSARYKDFTPFYITSKCAHALQ
jgi:hypothetical protein